MPLYMTTYQIRIIGITDIIMTIVAFSVAYGFFKGLRWSWFLGLITLVIVTILPVYDYLSSFWALSSYPGQSEIGRLSYIIVTYIVPVVILVILGLISIYLTRPHVKTYFGFGQPGDITSAVKENKRKIVSTVTVLVIIAGICIWGFTPSGDISIINVTQTPENPEPGDTVTVIAEISGGSPFLGVSGWV